MQSNIDRLIVGVDVSKHNLDVAGKVKNPSSWVSSPITMMAFKMLSKMLSNTYKSKSLKQTSNRTLSLWLWNLLVVMNNLLPSLPSVMDGKSVFLIHSNSEIGSKE